MTLGFSVTPSGSKMAFLVFCSLSVAPLQFLSQTVFLCFLFSARRSFLRRVLQTRHCWRVFLLVIWIGRPWLVYLLGFNSNFSGGFLFSPLLTFPLQFISRFSHWVNTSNTGQNRMLLLCHSKFLSVGFPPALPAPRTEPGACCTVCTCWVH